MSVNMKYSFEANENGICFEAMLSNSYMTLTFDRTQRKDDLYGRKTIVFVTYAEVYNIELDHNADDDGEYKFSIETPRIGSAGLLDVANGYKYNTPHFDRLQAMYNDIAARVGRALYGAN